MRARITMTSVLAVLLGFVVPAGAQMPDAVPSTDSVVARARVQMAACDSAWTDMTFVITVHERELDSDGKLKSEKTTRSRVYSRHDAEREVLLAIWKDGEPVSDKKLNKEIAKREKKRRERAEKREEDLAEGKTGSESKEHAMTVLEPFAIKDSALYDFTAVTADTIDGIPAWRVTVAAREDSEELMDGHIWVRADNYGALAEEYEPAKLPSKVHALKIELEYGTVGPGCAMPTRFRIAGHGKAFIFIKFNFEAEVWFDSVVVNPGLPDSLFEFSDN